MNTFRHSLAAGLLLALGGSAMAQWEDRTRTDHSIGTNNSSLEVWAADPVRGGAFAATQGGRMQWDGRVARVSGLYFDYSVPLTAACDPTTGRYLWEVGDPNGSAAAIFGIWGAGLNRNGSGVAFDLVRGTFLSVGGTVRGPGPAGNTFLLQNPYSSAALWVPVVSTSQPSLRLQPHLTTDLNRRRIVLFGGRDPSGLALGDTWEWNGFQWAQLQPALAPSSRWAGGLAFDPGRQVTVLHGGTDGITTFADTWEWQGAQWVQRANSARSWQGHHLFFDPQHNKVIAWRGGLIAGWQSMEAWDGATWSDLFTSPWPRNNPAHCNDSVRGRLVVFGGLKDRAESDETWEWDGLQWFLRQPQTRPPARRGAAMGYDPQRQRTVLCGGYNNYPINTMLSDTWEWDGNNWTQSPVGMGGYDLQFAWHPASNGLLLWSVSGGPYSTSTWKYDATGWHSLTTPANTPSIRGARMAARPSTGEVLLYGVGDPNPHASMWSFQGAWTLIDPVTSPGPLDRPVFVEDPATQLMLLVGGNQQANTYAWDGAAWTTQAYGATFLHGTGAIDPIRNSPVAISNGIHEWLRVGTGEAEYFTGCAGSRGGLALRSLDHFLIGNPSAGLGLTNALPGTPVAFAAVLGNAAYQSFGNCSLLQNPMWLGWRIANAAGAAEVTVPVPNQTYLLGLRFTTQAIALDPTSPPGAFAASSSIEVVVGG